MNDPEEIKALLSIYKMMKEKGIPIKENLEYEAMIQEEQKDKQHSDEFKQWHDGLPPQEQQDFDFVFGKN